MKGKNEVLELVSAYDEQKKDERDWVFGSENLIDFDKLPSKFILEDRRYQNQNEKWYTVSCTAQATTSAINNSLYVKAEKELCYDWRDLWDEMVDRKLILPSGAYIIDAIKLSRELNMSAWYYQVTNLLDIMNAIYKWDAIVTGSNKIKWADIREDWLVREVSAWSGHAFTIVGWDKDKKIGKYTWAIRCENSYWEDYQDFGGFWIPFELFDEILFPLTRKAIIVIPAWTKLTQEERKKEFRELRRYFKDLKKL